MRGACPPHGGDDVLPGPDPDRGSGELEHPDHEEHGGVEHTGTAAPEEEQEDGHAEGAACVRVGENGEAGDRPAERDRRDSHEERPMVARDEVGLGHP
jgi:hypothetical protein